MGNKGLKTRRILMVARGHFIYEQYSGINFIVKTVFHAFTHFLVFPFLPRRKKNMFKHAVSYNKHVHSINMRMPVGLAVQLGCKKSCLCTSQIFPMKGSVLQNSIWVLEILENSLILM